MASTATRVPLHRLAHGRAGDKGDTVNVSVIAYRPEDFPLFAREPLEDLHSTASVREVPHPPAPPSIDTSHLC